MLQRFGHDGKWFCVKCVQAGWKIESMVDNDSLQEILYLEGKLPYITESGNKRYLVINPATRRYTVLSKHDRVRLKHAWDTKNPPGNGTPK
jgi:hypothetical protein